MTNPNDDRKTHFEAVKALLPARYRKATRVTPTRLRVNGRLDVEMSRSNTYRSIYDRLKIDIDYGIRKDLNDSFRNRTYKKRERDGLFNYEAAAKYITKVLDEHSKLEARRALGQTKAEKTGERLKSLFKSNPLLQSLGMDVRSEPVLNDLDGRAKIAFVEENEAAGFSYSSFQFETLGEPNDFSGKLDLHCLSAEQVIALLVVLRADKLSLLDMLHLADDSIIGPIIKQLTEEEDE